MHDKLKEIRIVRTVDQDRVNSLKNSTTPEERWAMMWQLAQDAWAFQGKGEPIVELKLQRYIERVLRRKS